MEYVTFETEPSMQRRIAQPIDASRGECIADWNEFAQRNDHAGCAPRPVVTIACGGWRKPMKLAKGFASVAVLLISGQAMATTYSVSGDFSGTSNPNGVWAYGTLTALGGTFAAYPDAFTETAGGTVEGWATSGTFAPPDVWNNASGAAYATGTVDLLPGWAGFHPAICSDGPGCGLSDFRFTAPAAGSYTFALSFQGADTTGNTNTIVSVFINGSSAFSANIVGDGSSSLQTFNGTYNLTSGEIVDIAVASNNNGDNNSTAVQGTITSSLLPSIASIKPSSVNAGSAAFVLTVNGSNFVSGDTIDWNGIPLTTTFVSASKLTAKVSAAQVAAAGSAAVTVVDPGASGQASAAALFAIPLTNLVISSQTITTSSGGYSITLTLKNSGTKAATDVLLTGAYLATSATSSSLPIDIPSIAAKGSTTVTLNFPSSVGTAGVEEYLSIVGAYTGGAVSFNSVETLP